MAFKPELLKEKLKAEGKTHREFATAIKKDVRTIHRWLAGDNPPKTWDIEEIANILNCKPQDFDPFFADKDLGDISIQAHVSTASHNAYELMCQRYGVTQKQIMELAPVLFAIVAAHALQVPDQDKALEQEALRMGRPGTRRQEDDIDQKASKSRKCFGASWSNHKDGYHRNLFDTAIHRLSIQVEEYVATGWYVGAAPGDVPNASGYISDINLLETITNSDEVLIEAIVKGRIRLSTIIQKIKEEKEPTSNEQITDAIRSAYEQEINKQRKVGLKKLKAWHIFYAERHPELAKEYDDLMNKHCHAEGWYPDNYTKDDRIQSWINPFLEDLHINKDTLVEYQKRKEEDSKQNILTFIPLQEDPIYRRFNELQHHRAENKKQFEEIWT